MAKKLIVAVTPPKPVSEMTEAELDAFIDAVHAAAIEKLPTAE